MRTGFVVLALLFGPAIAGAYRFGYSRAAFAVADMSRLFVGQAIACHEAGMKFEVGADEASIVCVPQVSEIESKGSGEPK